MGTWNRKQLMQGSLFPNLDIRSAVAGTQLGIKMQHIHSKQLDEPASATIRVISTLVVVYYIRKGMTRLSPRLVWLCSAHMEKSHRGILSNTSEKIKDPKQPCHGFCQRSSQQSPLRVPITSGMESFLFPQESTWNEVTKGTTHKPYNVWKTPQTLAYSLPWACTQGTTIAG